jgi:hypothetical protein
MDFVADQPTLDLCATAGTIEPASDGRAVLHALPGIVLHLHKEHWTPVYLPALASYFVHDLTPRAGPHGYPAGAVVHLPEGLRGRRAKMVQRVDCARSPSAVIPCEGEPLGRELHPTEREDSNGHAWRYIVTNCSYRCVRCGCAGGVKPLTAEFAPQLQAPTDSGVVAMLTRVGVIENGLGQVMCAVGDAETRRKLHDGTLGYLTGGFGKQLYMTSPQSRRAILQRASSPFDVGGRWELPEDVTPETRLEGEMWWALDDLLLENVDNDVQVIAATYQGAAVEVAHKSSGVRGTWDEWLAGGNEAPPRWAWDPVYSALVTRTLPALLQRPGVIYLDTRRLLTALLRTGIANHMRMAHPAEELIRDLRAVHERVRQRDERASVMVLFPQLDEKLERDSGLLVARKVWASGR